MNIIRAIKLKWMEFRDRNYKVSEEDKQEMKDMWDDELGEGL